MIYVLYLPFSTFPFSAYSPPPLAIRRVHVGCFAVIASYPTILPLPHNSLFTIPFNLCLFQPFLLFSQINLALLTLVFVQLMHVSFQAHSFSFTGLYLHISSPFGLAQACA